MLFEPKIKKTLLLISIKKRYTADEQNILDFGKILK